MQWLLEGDDRHFAFERALTGRQMRLFVGLAFHVADLVEFGFGIAFGGQRFERPAHGRIVVGRDQHDVHAFGLAALAPARRGR